MKTKLCPRTLRYVARKLRKAANDQLVGYDASVARHRHASDFLDLARKLESPKRRGRK